MAKGIPFTAVVRAVMTERLPRYQFDRTEKGSGPVVFYRVPASVPRIYQEVYFQKGMYSTWLRANFDHSFVDKRKGLHALGDGNLDDVRYATEQELIDGLTAQLPTLEKRLAAQARAASKLVPRLSKLLDQLPAHASAWMKQVGNALPAEAFEDDSFAEPAFEQFKRWLKKQKLHVERADLGVWHWWTGHHPVAKPSKPGKRKPSKRKPS